MPPGTNDYNLNVQQAAEIVGVHPYTIKRWARAGKLAAVKTPGGWFRFRRSDLAAVLTPVEPKPESAA